MTTKPLVAWQTLDPALLTDLARQEQSDPVLLTWDVRPLVHEKAIEKRQNEPRYALRAAIPDRPPAQCPEST
jgi:hypothetical protein